MNNIPINAKQDFLQRISSTSSINAKNGNIEVWAFTWTQILSTARAKLEFLNQNLCYDADRESAKKYLLDKHEKYIPTVAKEAAIDNTDANSNSGEVENDTNR